MVELTGVAAMGELEQLVLALIVSAGIPDARNRKLFVPKSEGYVNLHNVNNRRELSITQYTQQQGMLEQIHPCISPARTGCRYPPFRTLRGYDRPCR